MVGNRGTHWFALLVTLLCLGPVVSIWLSVILAGALLLPRLPDGFVSGGLLSMTVLVLVSLVVSQLAALLTRVLPGRPMPKLSGVCCALLGGMGGVVAMILL